MRKEDIAVTVVLTTQCNMRCAYCINHSGVDLKCESGYNEWQSSDDIIACLKKISEVRNIATVKLFGGEPMLRENIICELLERRKEFSSNCNFRFAMTTNALEEMEESILETMIVNKLIFNISIDGPEEIHNEYRLAADGRNSFQAVMKNVSKLNERNYPFAAIAVLDERVLKHNYSIEKMCRYLSGITPVYKIEPAYFLSTVRAKEADIMTEQLLKQERDLINNLFTSIESLDVENFLYENNILRTISYAVNHLKKDTVCSAGHHVAIFPNKSAYACYNLMTDEFKISDDLNQMNSSTLNNRLHELQNMLSLCNYPQEYKDIEIFGDYCPKENNFSSFAYKYRKVMVDTILENISKIVPGSPQHLALLGYISLGFETTFYKNIPTGTVNIVD